MKEKMLETEKESNVQNQNFVAGALTTVAWFIFIVGIVAGISFASISLVMTIVYWCITLIFGTVFLGYAEIIKLLQDIKNK